MNKIVKVGLTTQPHSSFHSMRRVKRRFSCYILLLSAVSISLPIKVYWVLMIIPHLSHHLSVLWGNLRFQLGVDLTSISPHWKISRYIVEMKEKFSAIFPPCCWPGCLAGRALQAECCAVSGNGLITLTNKHKDGDPSATKTTEWFISADLFPLGLCLNYRGLIDTFRSRIFQCVCVYVCVFFLFFFLCRCARLHEAPWEKRYSLSSGVMDDVDIIGHRRCFTGHEWSSLWGSRVTGSSPANQWTNVLLTAGATRSHNRNIPTKQSYKHTHWRRLTAKGSLPESFHFLKDAESRRIVCVCTTDWIRTKILYRGRRCITFCFSFTHTQKSFLRK